MKSVLVFDNFNVAAFSRDGDQVPTLQKNLLIMWAEMAEKEGFDVAGQFVETAHGNWRIMKTEDGFHLEASQF